MVKIFISYAREDETNKNSLIEHLSSLKNSGVVNHWHDREINGGSLWDQKIESELRSSNIAILLISSSFISSDYIKAKELEISYEMEKLGQLVIIPVILRACDWKNCEFSRFQAYPSDAKPVKSWDDTDEAFMDIVKGIRKVIEEDVKHLNPIQQHFKLDHVEISENTKDWLENTGVKLTNRRVDKINLSDIYIPVDLDFSEEEDDIYSIYCSSKIIDMNKNCILFGEEQQGKTTLLKNIYKESLKKSTLPIYVNFSGLTSSNLSDLIKKI
ncbi:MAG: TIR domain-containing protein [Alteromonadaceae bacterium]|nr:TIR domain-containing protein [Alteromonadaceae bacterium]